jgi:hypothetical protein
VRRATPLALVMGLLAPLPAPADGALHTRRSSVVRHDGAVRVARTPHGRRPTTQPTRKPPGKPPVPKPPSKPPIPTPPSPPKPLARIQVVAREFSLTLSRRALAAGPVGIELDNFGQDPHDLRVERADAPSTGFSFTLAKPGTVSSKKLELAAGEWKLYCTLPGHEALGMSARVTVSG